MFIPLLLSILIIYPLKNIESTLNFNFECLPMIYKSTRQFDFYFCFELSVSGLAICRPVGASPTNGQENTTDTLLPIALLIIIHPAYTFIWHEIKKKNLCVAQLFDQQTLRRVVQSAHNCEFCRHKCRTLPKYERSWASSRLLGAQRVERVVAYS